MSGSVVAEALGAVRARIAGAARRAGRDPDDVQVVAVTKTFPAEVVREALAAGVDAVGENRAQDLLDKAAALAEGGTDAVPWHFVGRIQRNKVAKLVPLVQVWHSVDRSEAGEAIARRAEAAGSPEGAVRIYIQVDLAGEPQKGGCAPGEAVELVERLRRLDLEVEGLMTIPPFGADPRPFFSALAALARDGGVAGLSMGMSGDYEVAVEEGATVVRIGEALFGPRRP